MEPSLASAPRAAPSVHPLSAEPCRGSGCTSSPSSLLFSVILASQVLAASVAPNFNFCLLGSAEFAESFALGKWVFHPLISAYFSALWFHAVTSGKCGGKECAFISQSTGPSVLIVMVILIPSYRFLIKSVCSTFSSCLWPGQL